MRVWIVELTEPLPMEAGGRTMRCGHLAHALAEQGHEVLWWSSNFSHIGKRFRTRGRSRLKVRENYQVELMAGSGYARNVCLARIRSHAQRASAFRRWAPACFPPDVILSALPTLEVSEAVVEYGCARGIPVVVDVRDKWPDAFLTLVPPAARSILQWTLWPEFRRARRICGNASALFAVSHNYLDWGLAYAGRKRSELDAVFPLGYECDGATSPTEKAAQQRGAGGQAALCFVGTFGATYDLDTVIEAARILHSRGDARFSFVLAGDGPNASRWRARAQGLANVTFAGWLPAAGIAELLGQSRAGLAAYIPGAPQSLPNKIFEYFAGGLPVISSLTGECQQLLEEEAVGLTYQAGNAEDLVRCIHVLMSGDTATEMGLRARRLAETRFGAAQITRGMISRLQEICDSRASGRDVKTAVSA